MMARVEKADDAGVRLTRATRQAMVVLTLILVAVLATARWLEPNPKGFGTHTQLGLPPCHFAQITGHPCPSCGMTTAFAWAARGRFDRSWEANPAGALLAPACAALVPWLALGAARGKVLGFRSPEPPLIALLVTIVTVSLVSWMIRLLVSGR
jgi:Protein of unknown function (DUF2752)